MSTVESSIESDGLTSSLGRAESLHPPVSEPDSLAEKSIDSSSLVGWLDFIERFIVLVFYMWLVLRIIANYTTNGGAPNLLLLPSEGLVVVLFLWRRSARAISTRPLDWMLALGGTCSALLVLAEPNQNLVSPLIGASLILMGIVIQVLAKIALGRSLGCVPAHRGLKRHGPYSFVRHPMYAGYFVSHVGFLLLNPTLWNLSVYMVSESVMILRILAEERLLSNDPQYRGYRSVVRYRLIPGLF